MKVQRSFGVRVAAENDKARNIMEVKASAMILKAFQTCAFALFRAKFVQINAHLLQLFNSSVLVAGLHPTSSSSRSLSLTGTLRYAARPLARR